ncbi:nonribosomal peptide synthetase [Moniliophthora roreri]|uniref:Uncharacterized protein n=1 Tax=Moniliophthora roreri TaxID=221103 RepID=A0A0W0GBT5_MONRR|nr:nonribosomal peptide synthetase [Moniliophthora roreri]
MSDPLDNHNHLTDLVHLYWGQNPKGVLYAYPPASSFDTKVQARPLPVEYDEITYLEFGRAVHRAAHLVRPKPSPNDGSDGQVIAILAYSDTLVYNTVIMGLMTANLVPLPISPRNSPAAILSLLKGTDCRRILTTRWTMTELISSLEELILSEGSDLSLAIEEMPSLAELYPKLAHETPDDPFVPYTRLPKPSFDQVAIYLHSSGSTGFPKPIPLTHRGIWGYANIAVLREMREFTSRYAPHQRVKARMGGLAVPALHALGFLLQLIDPLFRGITTTLFPPIVWNKKDVPIMPTPENTLDALERTGTNMLVIFPTFLQIWAREPESIKRLANLEYVAESGGPLDKDAGDTLIRNNVRLRCMYGGTEFGRVSHILPRPGDEEDWQWMELDADRTAYRWLGAGSGPGGAYGELVFLTTETHTLSVRNLPEELAKRLTSGVSGLDDDDKEVDGWIKGKDAPLKDERTGLVTGCRTSDVWERHPTKHHLFRIIGRADDVLIHSSGEKTVPGPLESTIVTSPLVKGAVIFGHGRAQPGVLIEPQTHEHTLSKFRNLVWDVVDRSNAIAPAFSRIYKEMIIMTTPDRPLPRTVKDSVIRKAAIKNYERDIEELYSTIESNAGHSSSGIEPPVSWGADKLKEWLMAQAKDITSKPDDLTPEMNLFDWGFDSLSATILRLRIVAALCEAQGGNQVITQINQNMVYVHHTIEMLAGFIVGALGQGDDEHSSEKTVEEHVERMKKMTEKYAVKPIGNIHGDAMLHSNSSGKHTVLITGTTGGLGAQLLYDLLNDSRVDTVYALNRKSSGSVISRQKAKFVEKNLKTSVIDDALVTNKPRLFLLEGTSPADLSQDTLNVLHSELTIVIHSAWKLDFNLPLEGFEGLIADWSRLLSFVQSVDARRSEEQKIRVLFTSSISTAYRWARDSNESVFPEEYQEDPKYAVGGGYGESKYVSETILQNTSLNGTSFRIGQITGCEKSPAWSLSDWLPIIIKSGIEMSCMPDAVGVVSWIPGTLVSQTILDVAFTASPQPFAVNIVHPSSTPWSRIMRQIVDSLEAHGRVKSNEVKIVPWADWIKELESRASDLSDVGSLERVPAIKLIHFYRGMADADASHRSHGDYNGEAVDLPPLEVENAMKLSPAFKSASELNKQDVDAWVKWWIAAGV